MSDRHGIVAAVVDEDGVQIMTFGEAKADQLFEIGSVTKTFTANLLAQSVLDGSIKISDPIPAEYQKAGNVITYQNLTTHTSGFSDDKLPEYNSGNPLTPYAGLTIPIFKSMYAQTSLANLSGTAWSYSNIGVSLLGLILSEQANTPYESLVREKILKPLQMNETFFQVPNEKLNRLADGHMIMSDGKIENRPHWDLFNTAIDPAGGLRSTIADMAKYAQANLNPEGSALVRSIKLVQQPLYYIEDHKMWIGMNWIVHPEIGLVWHNGETYGFNTILAISKKKKQSVVAMTDTTKVIKDSEGRDALDASLQNVAFSCLAK